MTQKVILPRQVNRRIGQVMQDYAMLSHGDSVLVAVSGGVDSLVLAWLLHMWLRKAPISYGLRVVHIDMGFWGGESGGDDGGDGLNPVERIRRQLLGFNIPLQVYPAKPPEEGAVRSCFHCARQRRHQLFDLAREYGCNKIAFGHHKDDLIETLFLNMLYGGNLSTMVPRQDLFFGRLALIRPLAYIEKQEVRRIAMALGFTAVANGCPLAGDTRREYVRGLLQMMYDQDPGVKASIFAAMANVRKGYLL
jgi:tRNA 2-thiocytidine biosynthesis protein TtcA